jgi:hypothetical protein
MTSPSGSTGSGLTSILADQGVGQHGGQAGQGVDQPVTVHRSGAAGPGEQGGGREVVQHRGGLRR